MNENEPRVPAGSPDGGQWTAGPSAIKTPQDVAAYADKVVRDTEAKLAGPGRVGSGPGTHLSDGRRQYHGVQEAYVSPKTDAALTLKNAAYSDAFLNHGFTHREGDKIVTPTPEMKKAVAEANAKFQKTSDRLGLGVEIA